MSIATTDYRVQYSGNGATTAFATNFPFLDQDHLVVTETVVATGVDTVKTITTHYTVSGEGEPSGGTVTMLVAPASGVRLTIERIVPLTQPVDYTATDDFPAETHEQALDRLTQISQQLGANNASVDRSIKYKSTEPTGFTSEISDIVDRKGKVIAFNSSTGAMEMGDPTTLFASQLALIAADVAAADASADAAAVSEANAASSASAAQTAQTNAETAEANAELAETNAEAAQAAAEAAATGAYVKRTITQNSHGFAAGDVLKFASGVWAKAQANNAANSEAECVVESATTNDFVGVFMGYCTLTGLTQNNEYFLSPSSAGALTATEPSTAGQIIRRIGKAISTTVLIVRIQQPGIQVI